MIGNPLKVYIGKFLWWKKLQNTSFHCLCNDKTKLVYWKFHIFSQSRYDDNSHSAINIQTLHQKIGHVVLILNCQDKKSRTKYTNFLKIWEKSKKQNVSMQVMQTKWLDINTSVWNLDTCMCIYVLCSAASHVLCKYRRKIKIYTVKLQWQ